MREINSSKSLLKLILFSRPFHRLLILGLSFISTIFGLLTPYYQKEVIDWLSSGGMEFVLSPLIFSFLTFILANFFSQLTNYMGARESLIMQKKLSNCVYKKALTLKSDVLMKKPVGEVVAIYATDIPSAAILLDQTLPSGAMTFFPLIFGPLAIIYYFKISFWPTIITMICIIFINTLLAYRQSYFFLNFKKLAADRIGLVNEWIQNIRTLRILDWISDYEKKIIDKRVVETANRIKMVTNGQTMNAISTSVTFLFNVIALLTLIYSHDHKPTSGEILALLWIVGIFLVRPFRLMPWFFTMSLDAISSVRRLSEFLSIKNSEMQINKNSSLHIQNTGDEDLAIEIKNMNLVLERKEILRSIDLKIKKGEFIALVGEVGSGKSLFLLSLMGEVGVSFDRYHLFGKPVEKITTEQLREHFSYIPQEGFIMSASMRDNLGFDYNFNSQFDSQLEESLANVDFSLKNENLHQGLNTEIGERGVNLSGGQKQRVSLARIDFIKHPIILLDDCLSAVDVETEKKLFNHLLNGLWKNQTRLLVTHRLSVLHQVDRILFIQKGEIIEQGSYQELIQKSLDFRNFIATLIKSDESNLSASTDLKSLSSQDLSSYKITESGDEIEP